MKTLFAASLLTASAACAGDAFFSADGRTVTFAPLNKSGIICRLDVAGGKITELPLPAELKTAEVTGLARGGQGEALFLAGTAAWVMTDDGTVKRITELGKVTDAQNLFVATKPGTPLTDWLFLSGMTDSTATSQVFFARKPGTKGFSEVFCRRVANVDCGCFSDDGRFFFSASGDLWEGGFAPDDDPRARIATLIGARIAPVAMHNTDGGNGGNLWISGLNAAGKWIYAGMRGRHMGCILRVPIPDKPLYTDDGGDLPEPKTHLEAMRTALEKTELLVTDMDGLTAFAACEVEGKPRIFYRSEGAALWLWNATGAPKEIAREPQE